MMSNEKKKKRKKDVTMVFWMGLTEALKLYSRKLVSEINWTLYDFLLK